mgnify:CR=1 FL=1
MLEYWDKDICIFDFLTNNFSLLNLKKIVWTLEISAFDEAKILGFYFGEKWGLFEERKVLNALFRRVPQRRKKRLKY